MIESELIRRPTWEGEDPSHIDTVRSYPPDTRWLRLQHRSM